MHYSDIRSWNTLSTVMRLTWRVIIAQRQFVLLAWLALRVLNMAGWWGVEQLLGPEVTSQLVNREPGSTFSPDVLENIDTTLLLQKFPVLLIGAVIMIIIYLLIHISVVITSFTTIQEQHLTLQESFQHAWKKIWNYLVTNILQWVLLLLLTLLLVIPWIIFMVYWYFASYVVIFSNKSWMDALRESKKIVAGRWWKTLWYILLFAIFAGGAMVVIGGIMWLITSIVNQAEFTVASDVLLEIITYWLQVCIVIMLSIFFLRWNSTSAKD